ncbi:hypothetical protein NM688_g3259 [Phlebia brevispora]|uniref:Uncharacterized protein n=1 Tax=Phlebia brevispora TaxID=194682 RepID=A0ACC1T6X5_9APHY|nr:hypothetical protein NM688_g3259 [Phlebia brevispora]
MSHTQTSPTTTPTPTPVAHLPHSYHIFSQESGFIVGRKPGEDKSFLPKAIYTLKAREHGWLMMHSRWRVRQWTFEPGSKLGQYKIKAGGDRVGERDALLWAFLDETEQAQATEWIVSPVPQAGPDAYIILSPVDYVGWAAATDKHPDHEQVRVRPLIATGSNPPGFPAWEVFIIKRAKEYGPTYGSSISSRRRGLRLFDCVLMFDLDERHNAAASNVSSKRLTCRLRLPVASSCLTLSLTTAKTPAAISFSSSTWPSRAVGSLARYHIYSQATDAMDRDADRLRWSIECGSCDGLYKMKVKDTPVGQEEKLLCAFPDEKDMKKVEERFVRAVTQMGDAAYIIQTSDESVGWDTPGPRNTKGQMKQINVHALAKLPPNPCPESCVSQVFIIKPVKLEDESTSSRLGCPLDYDYGTLYVCQFSPSDLRWIMHTLTARHRICRAFRTLIDTVPELQYVLELATLGLVEIEDSISSGSLSTEARRERLRAYRHAQHNCHRKWQRLSEAVDLDVRSMFHGANGMPLYIGNVLLFKSVSNSLPLANTLHCVALVPRAGGDPSVDVFKWTRQFTPFVTSGVDPGQDLLVIVTLDFWGSRPPSHGFYITLSSLSPRSLPDMGERSVHISVESIGGVKPPSVLINGGTTALVFQGLEDIHKGRSLTEVILIDNTSGAVFAYEPTRRTT